MSDREADATVPRRLVLTWGFAVLMGGCSGDAVKSAEKVKERVREPRTLTIAAASDLKFALDEVIARFHERHPDITVKVAYGSSGNFFAQLSNRAPFDVFLSADVAYPHMLIEKGLALKETEFLYALGRIVVWVPKESSLDPQRSGIEVVVDPSVRKVAIANPRIAPYGRAAEAALKNLGVYDRVQQRLVLGENVGQTAQFAQTGAAEVGIIAQSLALAPAMRDTGRYWLVPADAYPPIEQGGVVLSWASDKEAALALRSFVTGREGRAILGAHGFVLPGEGG
jgi:molybdate transport system substrate-binding protein